MPFPQPAGRQESAIRTYTCLFLVLLLAAALRIIHLGTYPFWADEVHNLLCSEDPLGMFLQADFAANHPPLPYLLLAAWRALGMDGSEWALRGLPALFGVLGVAAIFWIASLLFDRKTGLIAALLLAISPFHLTHSQDLKEYIYLPFVGTLMVGFLFKAASANRRRDWLGYGVLAGLGCYTEAFVMPLLVAINLWFLFSFYQDRRRLVPWFFANALGALIFLPWLGLMLRKVHDYMIAAEFWVPYPTPWSVLFYFKTIAFGYSAVKPFFYIAFVIFALLTAWACWAAWNRNRRVACLVLMWAAFPVALVYALSFISQSIFLIRALIPYSIALYLLVALGVTSLRPRALQAGTLFLLAVLAAVGVTAHYQRNLSPTEHPHNPGIHIPREDPLAARYILDRFEEGDIVIHGGMGAWLPFYWYGFRDRPQYFGGINAEYIRIIYAGNPINTDDEALLRLWPKLIDELVPGYRRIWYVFAEWQREYLDGNPTSVWRWLDSRYLEVDHAVFKDIEVLLYVTPNHPEAPRALARIRDDLVSADYRYSARDALYHKVKPDIGLIAKPEVDRRGCLEVRLSEGTSEIVGRRAMRVEVTNIGASERRFKVEMIASDALLSCIALDRKDPKSNSWHFDRRYRAEPGYVPYDLGTLTGNFAFGPAAVGGSVSLPPGTYVPWLNAALPTNRPEFLTAPLSIRLNGESSFASVMETGNAAQWTWISGEPVEVDATGSVQIDVDGRPLEGPHSGYANLGYLAFVRVGLPQDAVMQVAAPLSIAPGESRVQVFSVPADLARVDAWIYGLEPDGQGYYLFQVFDAPQ